MIRAKPYIISGVCVCGHSWQEHHLGFIMNEQAMAEILEQQSNHPGYVPQECEAYGFNESGGLDENGDQHCQQYVDVEHLPSCTCEVCRAWGN